VEDRQAALREAIDAAADIIELKWGELVRFSRELIVSSRMAFVDADTDLIDYDLEYPLPGILPRRF
jgi:hypothetical protein